MFDLPELDQFPTDFSATMTDALKSWATQIREMASGLSADNDDELEKLEALGGHLSAIETELADRKAKAEAAAERKARVAAAFETTEEESSEDTPEDADEELSDEDDADEDADFKGGKGKKKKMADEDADDDKSEASNETDTVDEDEILDDSDDESLGDHGDKAHQSLSAAQRAAQMQANAPESRDNTGTGASNVEHVNFVATNQMQGFSGGDMLTIDQLAEGLTKTRLGLSKIKAGGDDVVLATSTIEDDSLPALGADEFTNFETLLNLQRETQAAHNGSNGLIASGAVCLPETTDYSFFRLAKAHRPVEANLPRVAAPQGQIRYVVPPDWAYLSGGVSSRDCAQEAEPSITYPDKAVIEVACPALAQCCVSSISRIIQFSNLTYRAWPGFTREAIYQLGVAYTEAKEIMYLDDIDAGSTAITAMAAADVFSAQSDMVSRVLTAAYGYRKRHRMNMDDPLTFMVNDVVMYLNAIDAFRGGERHFGRDPEGALRAVFAKHRINLVFFYNLPTSATVAQGQESAPGANDGIFGPQAAGALNELPTEVAGYLFAPGTFIRLDGGTLDLGIVRDSILNTKNDLHIFAEQWTKVCKIGYESVKLPIAQCPRGVKAGEIVLAC